MTTWPERPKTDEPVRWPAEGQRPDWWGTSVNWIGDEYPPAAIPGVDLWNGEPIPDHPAFHAGRTK